MTHAIRIHQIGGPEVLQWEAIEVGKTGPDEIRIRHGAVGLNYIDTYHRSGAYPIDTPATPGLEAAGVVEETGANVTDLKIGDRVAYASPPMGAYAEARLMPADRVVNEDHSGDHSGSGGTIRGQCNHSFFENYDTHASE